MTRDEADQMVQEFYEAFGGDGQTAFVKTGFVEFILAKSQISFEYIPQRNGLKASALIYRYEKPPDIIFLAGLKREIQLGADTGGGMMDYERENQCLGLGRLYPEVVSAEQLTQDLEKLGKAAFYWSEEVMPRTVRRIYHPVQK